MNVENLRTLAKHLRNLPEDQFDMRKIGPQYGPCGCIAHHAALISGADLGEVYLYAPIARDWLELTNEVADALFFPKGDDDYSITATQAALVVDYLADTDEADFMRTSA